MIHEGQHQGLQDHLWLFYYAHFTDKILGQLRPAKREDSEHEFPSPFHFLLYKIVSITMDWIDEAQYVNDKTALILAGDSLNDDNSYIPFSAVLAMGQIFTAIISSNKLNEGFKSYMLVVVLRRLAKIQAVDCMKTLSRVLQKSLIYRNDIWKTDLDYLEVLSLLYGGLDRFLQKETVQFKAELDDAIRQARNK
jgi:hypothetical protein